MMILLWCLPNVTENLLRGYLSLEGNLPNLDTRKFLVSQRKVRVLVMETMHHLYPKQTTEIKNERPYMEL